MKKLPLPNGLFTLLDDDDFDRCAKFKWRVNEKGYVVRTFRRDNGREATQRLSRFIMNDPEGLEVDHIHGDKFDNRKSELRVCTHTQNLWNRGKLRNNTSGFKGVYWNKRQSRWHARISVNGASIHLGFFSCLIEAAGAYKEAARSFHGEFAKT